MVKIDLTPQQAAELRNHYINELDKLQKRSTEILNLLKAIGHESTEHEVKQEDPVEESIEQKAPEKKSTNPRWSDYILKLLNVRDRAVTNNQIFKSYQKEFNVEFTDPKSVKNSLSQALHYLQNTKKLIESTPRKGKRGHLYRLVQEDKTPMPVEKKLPKPKKEKPKQSTDVDAPEEKYLKFVEDVLKREKRILNRDEFVDYALNYFNEPPKHKISTRGKVAKALAYMAKETGQVNKTKKEGQKGTYFGLPNWFDDKKLIPDYK